ncbi:IS4 family transposase [Candidatus Tisiphia endosymbiont of Dioctria rufipes]|uniref:IS4 family transposase n=1 Tax=Candidatus Tisiphia endosymbiont of Dioctria rufipes TaxID=3066255 RepID=UPI00312C7D65
MAGIDADQWLLVLDRTNWKFGKLDINILVLSICHKGIAIPIMWDMLPKAGISNNVERQQLMERFITIFGIEKMSALLGDRKFISDLWLKFLADKMIPFYIRIKANLTIGRAEDELVTANHLIKKLQNGEYMLFKGKRYLGKNYKGPKVSVAALRNAQGELVIIATNDNPNIALNIYKKRWEIESLFACLKTRGFNFENTHIIHLDRISKLLGLLAIAFTFAYVVGQWQNSIKPIKLKKHGRKSISLFRYGLDYLQRIFLNIEEMMKKWMEVITKFIKPIIPSLLRLSPC